MAWNEERGERTHPLDRNTLQASASRAEIGTRCKQYDRIRSTATEIGDKGKEELARLRALQEEQKALEGQIQALQADLRARQLTTQEVFAIKPERA